MSLTLPKLLDTDELAEFMQIPKRTLEDWRSNDRGPDWIPLGKHVRYRLEDVLEYLEKQKHRSGSADA